MVDSLQGYSIVSCCAKTLYSLRLNPPLTKKKVMKENITSSNYLITNNLSDRQVFAREVMSELFLNAPIPAGELLDSLQLITGRQVAQRFIFLNEMYKEIINLHGVIMEFGVRWSVNMANMISLRSIYEPYNPTRKIIGFDTFEGFPNVTPEDGLLFTVQAGSHAVTEGYCEYLEKILSTLESDSPIEHLRKFELVKGDATKTITDYIDRNQETLIALAYFDFDIYLPTKEVLLKIRDRLVKGAVVAFDELNYHRYPGETLAFLEVMGANSYSLIRSPNSGTVSYMRF